MSNMTYVSYLSAKYISIMKNLLIALALISIAVTSCNMEPPAKQIKIEKMTNESTTKATPGFTHAVYFWLKKDNPALLEEFKTKGLAKLATVSSIQSVTWGPPAGTPREVVDNSYDMAWIIHFANAADQDEYQVDLIHLEFVELYKSLFERVQVYDNVVQHHSN